MIKLSKVRDMVRDNVDLGAKKIIANPISPLRHALEIVITRSA